MKKKCNETDRSGTERRRREEARKHVMARANKRAAAEERRDASKRKRATMQRACPNGRRRQIPRSADEPKTDRATSTSKRREWRRSRKSDVAIPERRPMAKRRRRSGGGGDAAMA